MIGNLSNCYFSIAAKSSDDMNNIEYLMAWKDNWSKSIISSGEAKLKWPLLTMEFLESHLCFVKEVKTVKTVKTPNEIQSNEASADNQGLSKNVHWNDSIGVPLEVTCKQ